MARIGVITMNRVVNYGSVLQTYATQQILRRLGHECDIIDYRYPNEFHIKNGKKVKPLTFKSKVLRFLSITPRWRKQKAFRQFQQRYLYLSREYVSPDDIKDNPPNYDVYMAGSDQVWNPKYIFGDTTFLLSFVPSGRKKVSYASSFSTNVIPDSLKRDYSMYLSQFDNISVRENNGATIVRQLTGRNASVDLDPTLLLTPNDWDIISDKRPLLKEPYILVYILTYAVGDMSYLNNLIQYIKNKKNLRTVYLGTRIKGIEYDKYISACSPTQFLNLIKGASHVITTSFHGTAFSINYGIPFTAIVDNKADDRILTLLLKLGAEKYAIKRNESPLAVSYDDFDKSIEKKLSTCREKSISSLKNSIEG